MEIVFLNCSCRTFGNNRFVTLFSLLFLLLSAGENTGAETLPADPVTIYSRKTGFITRGWFPIDSGSYQIRSVLEDRDAYDQWALSGMGESEAREKNLKVSLNRLEPDGEDIMVFFSLFLTRNWILKDREIGILPEFRPAGASWVNRFRFSMSKKSLLVKEAFYDIHMVKLDGDLSLVFYEFRVKLLGPAAWLFSKDLYEFNIEWYIRRFLLNLKSRMWMTAG